MSRPHQIRKIDIEKQGTIRLPETRGGVWLVRLNSLGEFRFIPRRDLYQSRFEIINNVGLSLGSVGVVETSIQYMGFEMEIQEIVGSLNIAICAQESADSNHRFQHDQRYLIILES